MARIKYKDDLSTSNLIGLLSFSYREHKRMLDEFENGYRDLDIKREHDIRFVCNRIEKVVENMPQEMKLILQAEILENKKGTKWYREFYSVAQYYNKRKIAYIKFLDAINK